MAVAAIVVSALVQLGVRYFDHVRGRVLSQHALRSHEFEVLVKANFDRYFDLAAEVRELGVSAANSRGRGTPQTPNVFDSLETAVQNTIRLVIDRAKVFDAVLADSIQKELDSYHTNVAETLATAIANTYSEGEMLAAIDNQNSDFLALLFAKIQERAPLHP